MSKHYTLIVGSMLGATEYVADALAEVLQQQGYTSEIMLSPDLDAIKPDSTWIVCSSTHGAGDLPDNIQAFAMMLEGADLHNVQCYVIGLGDTSYDTYCFGAKKLTALLQQGGATLLADPLFIDVLEHPVPEDLAGDWLKQQLDQ